MDKITPIQLLLPTVSVLASVIIFLVYYIKDIHKKTEDKTALLNKAHDEKTAELYKRHEERLAEMYKEGLKMTQEMINAINRNSDTNDRILGTTDKNNVAINELYKFLNAQNKRR